MELNEWISKWSKPYWMDSDPKDVVCNITPEHYGQINLMWILMGRKAITQKFFDHHMDRWHLAGRICTMILDGAPIRDTATALNEQEFHAFVRQHPEVFSAFLPMTTWDRMFKKKTTSNSRKSTA